MADFVMSRDYRPTLTPRQRSDARHTDWEKSPAVYWGKDLLNGLCAVFSIGAVIALLFRVMA